MPKSKKEIDKEIMFNKIMPTGAGKRLSASTTKITKPYEPTEEEKKRAKAEASAEPSENYDITLKTAEELHKEHEKPTADINIDEYINNVNKKLKKEVKDEVEQKPSATESNKEAQKPAPKEVVQPPKSEEPSKPIMTNSVQTIMVNIREKMVMERLDEALTKFNCCTCFFCKQDVTTMALNNLKPKYIITTSADIDKIIAKEDYTEVTAAIMKAILYVKTHPRH